MFPGRRNKTTTLASYQWVFNHSIGLPVIIYDQKQYFPQIYWNYIIVWLAVHIPGYKTCSLSQSQLTNLILHKNNLKAHDVSLCLYYESFGPAVVIHITVILRMLFCSRLLFVSHAASRMHSTPTQLQQDLIRMRLSPGWVVKFGQHCYLFNDIILCNEDHKPNKIIWWSTAYLLNQEIWTF